MMSQRGMAKGWYRPLFWSLMSRNRKRSPRHYNAIRFSRVEDQYQIARAGFSRRKVQA